MQTINKGNILTNGRNERGYLLNLLLKIKLGEEEKTHRKTYSKKRKTLSRGKKLAYNRKGHIYLGSGFPIGALISAATSLLGPALFKNKIFKNEKKR